VDVESPLSWSDIESVLSECLMPKFDSIAGQLREISAGRARTDGLLSYPETPKESCGVTGVRHA